MVACARADILDMIALCYPVQLEMTRIHAAKPMRFKLSIVQHPFPPLRCVSAFAVNPLLSYRTLLAKHSNASFALLSIVHAGFRYTTTMVELEAALESLSTIVDVTLRVSDSISGQATAICSQSGTSLAIEFLSPTGDVPLLGTSIIDVDSAHLVEEQKGTKEDEVCSGRGLCDQTTGSCTCFPGFGSSNGQGEKGVLDDCGYIIPIFRCEDGSLEC